MLTSRRAYKLIQNSNWSRIFFTPLKNKFHKMYTCSYVCISNTLAGKVVPLHIRETSKGSRVRSKALVILNFGTRWKGVVTFPHQPHSSREKKKPNTHWIGRWIGNGGLEALRRRKISFSCWNFKPGPSRPYSSRHTDYANQDSDNNTKEDLFTYLFICLFMFYLKTSAIAYFEIV